MAATVLADAGWDVTVFEKRKAPGRKLLVAGSSGLNITYGCPPDEFARRYGASEERFRGLLAGFGPRDWTGFIEGRLGIPTFEGTSRRWFVEGMKAPALLKAWTELVTRLGARFEFGRELSGLEKGPVLTFADGSSARFDAAVIALGGGSWEPQESPLRWPSAFSALGVAMEPFRSSNAGFAVPWPSKLLEEAEGQPIKNVVLSSSKGSRAGDLVITAYGIEGTPVYFAGVEGEVRLDLKPDLDVRAVEERLSRTRENLSPMRRAQKLLGLGVGAQALVFHLAPAEARKDLGALARVIKAFPLTLGRAQPLAEAISSSGGVRWDELDSSLMLRKCPGVFLAGEMIDWDAPTGGFLIQGCVATGFTAARAAIKSYRG
jgi:hypothetical protein